jgi:hypothetical protein
LRFRYTTPTIANRTNAIPTKLPTTVGVSDDGLDVSDPTAAIEGVAPTAALVGDEELGALTTFPGVEDSEILGCPNKINKHS